MVWLGGIGIYIICDIYNLRHSLNMEKNGDRPKSRLAFRSVLWGIVRFYRCRSCFGVRWVCGIRSILAIADVTGLGGIESQVADGRNQTVNPASDNRQEHISKGSGSIAFRFQRRVVDDNASDPSQKKVSRKRASLWFSLLAFPFVCVTFDKKKRCVQPKFYAPKNANSDCCHTNDRKRECFRTPRPVEFAFLPAP